MAPKNPVYSSRFVRKAKKLRGIAGQELDDAVHDVLENPEIGQSKKGDLAGVCVYKFKMCKQETLLAYSADAENVYFVAFGSHENFYRDLKI